MDAAAASSGTATKFLSAREELDHAARLLDARPEATLAAAEAILRRAPGLPPAELLAGQALRRLGRAAAALPRLAALARKQPRVPAVLWELAQAASEAGRAGQAIAALESLTSQQPSVAGGWFLLAGELRKIGRVEDAWRADLSGVHASSGDPGLLEAAVAMQEGRLDESETLPVSSTSRTIPPPSACWAR